MATKKSQNLSQPQAEEIEWTPEDDAIMDKVWADLRKKLGGKLPSQIQREQAAAEQEEKHDKDHKPVTKNRR